MHRTGLFDCQHCNKPPHSDHFSHHYHPIITIFQKARGLRLLSPEAADAAAAANSGGTGLRVVAALSLSSGAPLRVPLARGAAEALVPRFSNVEAAHMLHHYHERGAAEAPSAAAAEKLRALCHGAGDALRRLGPRAAQLGDLNTL